jgi:tetratricopeptide (TPR) repeat protein
LVEQIQIHNAIEDFNQALNLLQAQNYPNIYYKRAFACQLTGRYTEAIIDYSMFIRNSQDDAHKGYLSRGLVYSEIKQYDNALNDIEHANQACQKSTKYYMYNKYYTYCLARAYASLGRDDEAKITFNELANICHNEHQQSMQTFHTHFYHGVAFYELNNYPAALQQFNEALTNYDANKNDQVDTKFYIGLTYYALGQIEYAKKELTEVLILDENHTRALFRLGMMQSQNDHLQSEALDYLTKAHRLHPHKSDILYERGDLYHKMGHLDACVHDKQRALQLERTDVDASSRRHYYEVR